PRRKILPFEPDAVAGAIELGAIHASVSISGFAVAALQGQLQASVVARRPASDSGAAPAVKLGMHFSAVTIFVIIRLGTSANQPQKALLSADSGVQHLVVASVTTGQGTAEDAGARCAEAFGTTLEQNRPGKVAATVAHGLRPLDHGH